MHGVAQLPLGVEVDGRAVVLDDAERGKLIVAEARLIVKGDVAGGRGGPAEEACAFARERVGRQGIGHAVGDVLILHLAFVFADGGVGIEDDDIVVCREARRERRADVSHAGVHIEIRDCGFRRKHGVGRDRRRHTLLEPAGEVMAGRSDGGSRPGDALGREHLDTGHALVRRVAGGIDRAELRVRRAVDDLVGLRGVRDPLDIQGDVVGQRKLVPGIIMRPCRIILRLGVPAGGGLAVAVESRGNRLDRNRGPGQSFDRIGDGAGASVAVVSQRIEAVRDRDRKRRDRCEVGLFIVEGRIEVIGSVALDSQLNVDPLVAKAGLPVGVAFLDDLELHNIIVRVGREIRGDQLHDAGHLLRAGDDRGGLVEGIRRIGDVDVGRGGDQFDLRRGTVQEVNPVADRAAAEVVALPGGIGHNADVFPVHLRPGIAVQVLLDPEFFQLVAIFERIIPDVGDRARDNQRAALFAAGADKARAAVKRRVADALQTFRKIDRHNSRIAESRVSDRLYGGGQINVGGAETITGVRAKRFHAFLKHKIRDSNGSLRCSTSGKNILVDRRERPGHRHRAVVTGCLGFAVSQEIGSQRADRQRVGKLGIRGRIDRRRDRQRNAVGAAQTVVLGPVGVFLIEEVDQRAVLVHPVIPGRVYDVVIVGIGIAVRPVDRRVGRAPGITVPGRGRCAVASCDSKHVDVAQVRVIVEYRGARRGTEVFASADRRAAVLQVSADVDLGQRVAVLEGRGADLGHRGGDRHGGESSGIIKRAVSDRLHAAHRHRGQGRAIGKARTPDGPHARVKLHTRELGVMNAETGGKSGDGAAFLEDEPGHLRGGGSRRQCADSKAARRDACGYRQHAAFPAVLYTVDHAVIDDEGTVGCVP